MLLLLLLPQGSLLTPFKMRPGVNIHTKNIVGPSRPPAPHCPASPPWLLRRASRTNCGCRSSGILTACRWLMGSETPESSVVNNVMNISLHLSVTSLPSSLQPSLPPFSFTFFTLPPAMPPASCRAVSFSTLASRFSSSSGGVRSSRCQVLLVSRPPGLQSSRCTVLPMYSPPIVQSSRCPVLPVFSPPSVKSSWYPVLPVSSPPGVQSSRCPVLQVSSPPGVQASWWAPPGGFLLVGSSLSSPPGSSPFCPPGGFLPVSIPPGVQSSRCPVLPVSSPPGVQSSRCPVLLR